MSCHCHTYVSLTLTRHLLDIPPPRYCNFELQAGEGGFVVKPLIQKINVQGLTYVHTVTSWSLPEYQTHHTHMHA